MSSSDSVRPWVLDWRPDHIRRFWDWQGTNDQLDEKFFSRMVGPSIVAHLRRYVPSPGTVLDLGAGPGHLTEALVDAGIPTVAVDISPDSVARITERLRGHSNFLGAHVNAPDRVPLPDASVGTVLLIETVEHLLPEVAAGVFAEARRLLRPGGYLMITTPNEENLAASRTMCPSCGCVFHTVQHLRSISADLLVRETSAAGFRPVVCRPTLFRTRRGLGGLAQSAMYTLRGRPLPHLMYVGASPR